MKKLNRLSISSSPYLRQHADNPVEWYEWGEEALSKAKKENKPLIISIGYAACHWCHVMAHESFSNDNVASFMNDNFVCIKIDREERPDIDQIYMEAAHIISGRGGWPLNAIAMPDGRPFYAATYFPPAQWLDVLGQLTNVYNNDMPRVLRTADSITKGLSANPFGKTSTQNILNKELYNSAYEQHIKKIDFRLGGYKGAPKFMMPVGLEFLLQYIFFTGSEKALEAVTVSLNAMARGGLNDQIGGGFARYSTDDKWIVPHFEKMLYDNAQLISLYSKAFQLTKNPFYKETVEKTITFAERELLDKCGGFYASIDADSEHEEGKFYVWTKTEFESVLDEKSRNILLDFYNIIEEGNWEHGNNILFFSSDKELFANIIGLNIDEFNNLLNKANEQLFDYRKQRIRPSTDDKILCSWNALMISGYINAFKAIGNKNYLDGALRTANFIENNLFQSDGSLFRVWKDGKVSTKAFLDDYSLLADAYIELYQVTLDIHWLNLSLQLADYCWLHFGNDDKSMFYYTSDISENLVARKYEYSDNVIPASNSVLAHVFYKLGLLFVNKEYTESAQKMLSNVLDDILEHGSYYANWAQLLGKLTHPSFEVAITGNNAIEKALELQTKFLPTAIITGGKIENLPLLQNRLVEGKTLIFVCEDNACKLPVETVEDAFREINFISKQPLIP